MKTDGLYIIENFSFNGQAIEAAFLLNKAHWIFDVHFKDKPIVPGAVLVSIAARFCSMALSRKLRVVQVSDAKFKIGIEPGAVDKVLVSITLSGNEEGRIKGGVSYFIEAGSEKKTAAALSVVLKEVLRPDARPDIYFVIPFYNNPKTIASVISSVKAVGFKVIAVNDGSTDNQTLAEAQKAEPSYLVSYSSNRGKGYAIRQGFSKALELGASYALVFDADGQHTPAGAIALIEKQAEIPEAERLNSIIVGSRCKRGADSGGRFANNFSNFWLRVQTGRRLSDTQSGLRLYPLKKISGVRFFGNRYEFETEVLVRMAWRGVHLMEAPVDVVYPEDRVTHFRKGADFLRISVMNTFLTIGALFYGYPRMFFRWLLGRCR